MLKIEILQDEELQEILNKFTSALLPHDNYDPSMFTTILNTIFRYIKLEEMQMEYKVLYGLFTQLSNIKAHFGDQFVPKLTRDNLEGYLNLNLETIVSDPLLGLKEWLEYEGMNSNLKVEDAKYAACSKLMERSMQLYDTCFELSCNSNEILNEEPSLQSAFLTHCSSICINTQRQVLVDGKKIGRKYYSDAKGWLDYTMYSAVEIKQRINDVGDDNVITLDDIAKTYNVLDELKLSRIPIAKYGIPELDGDFDMDTVTDSSTDPNILTPILRHRFVVVVGKENIGKTKFAVDQAVNVMLQNHKVVYMCGETNKSKILCDILINYINKKYGYIVRPEDITGLSEATDVVQKVINLSLLEIVDNGLLTLTDSFNYATVYSELQALYDTNKFDMCVIDHSCALIGTVGDGSVKSKIDALADAVKLFRKDYPVCVMVTSHPSSVAKTMDNKGDNISDSPTRGSQNLSTDADEVFVLRENEASIAEGTIFLENTKRRNVGRITEWIKLQKQFEVSRFIYKRELQVIDASSEVTSDIQNQLNSIVSGLIQSDEESL